MAIAKNFLLSKFENSEFSSSIEFSSKLYHLFKNIIQLIRFPSELNFYLDFIMPVFCPAGQLLPSDRRNNEENSVFKKESKRTSIFSSNLLHRIHFFPLFPSKNRSTKLSTRGVENLGIIVDNSKFRFYPHLLHFIQLFFRFLQYPCYWDNSRDNPVTFRWTDCGQPVDNFSGIFHNQTYPQPIHRRIHKNPHFQVLAK